MIPKQAKPQSPKSILSMMNVVSLRPEMLLMGNQTDVLWLLGHRSVWVAVVHGTEPNHTTNNKYKMHRLDTAMCRAASGEFNFKKHRISVSSKIYCQQ